MANNVRYSIVIPCYNEEQILPQTLSSLADKLSQDNPEIIIVDDGSTDNTYSICKKFEEKNPNIKSYKLPHRGRGSALKFGILHSNGEFCFLSSADIMINKKEVEYVKSLIEKGIDIILFSKNLRDSKIKGRSKKRKILSNLFAMCCRILLNLPYHDTQGMKAGKTEACKQIARLLQFDDFLFDTEFCFSAYKNRYKIVETPWELTDNLRESKVKIGHIVRMLIGLFLIATRNQINLAK